MEERDDVAETEKPCLPASFAEARVERDDLPFAFYYIPSFITPAEEAQLLRKVYSCPAPLWRVLPSSLRRLQSHPSELLPRTNALIDAPLPKWLEEPIVSRVLSIPLEKGGPENVFSSTPHKRPNHVLVNEYTVDPPQGILDHEDGPAYATVTCTVSLGGGCVLEVREKEKEGKRKRWRIFVEGRSLLLTTGTAYQCTLHGIEARTDDRIRGSQGAGEEGTEEVVPIANLHMLGGTYEDVVGRTNRVSLTYRDVLNVKSVNLKALGLGMGKIQR